MGTSTAYGGPDGKTPLIPSWLDDSVPAASTATLDGLPLLRVPSLAEPPSRPPIPDMADSKRFQYARSHFTRFAGSGGYDRANLSKAISKYISTSAGGSRQAAQRMGASRGAGARLLGFLGNAHTNGLYQALQELNLGSLAGRPVNEVLVGLADYICPQAGSIDDGIAREAYIETIIDLTYEGLTDLEKIFSEQMDTVFELYVTHAIEARICNDIGTKAVTMPKDVKAAHRVEQQLRDFIRGGVSDALARERERSPHLPPERIQLFVGNVYESAFEILKALSDAEADE